MRTSQIVFVSAFCINLSLACSSGSAGEGGRANDDDAGSPSADAAPLPSTDAGAPQESALPNPKFERTGGTFAEYKVDLTDGVAFVGKEKSNGPGVTLWFSNIAGMCPFPMHTEATVLQVEIYNGDAPLEARTYGVTKNLVGASLFRTKATCDVVSGSQLRASNASIEITSVTATSIKGTMNLTLVDSLASKTTLQATFDVPVCGQPRQADCAPVEG